MKLFCPMRYFLELSYKGTHYSGWQIQANAHTVQAELNQALSVLLKSEMTTMGSGRTDTGVHALHQVVHFDTPEAIQDPDHFLYQLNALLPKDIAVHKLRLVQAEAHARFDAQRRAYKYFIRKFKDPFASQDAYFFNQRLDIDKIRAAIEIIKNWQDFEAFSRVKTEVNHFDCKIFEAKWELSDKGYVFYSAADRFLRGMVRAVVGTLLDVGTGRMTTTELQEVLKSRDRRKAGRAVPAEGLYLCEVKYPQHIYS